MPDEPLEIVISGARMSGKTAATHAIRDALTALGARVQIMDTDAPDYMMPQYRRAALDGRMVVVIVRPTPKGR